MKAATSRSAPNKDMLFSILKHEWRNLTADNTVKIVTLLFLVLLGYGIYNNASWVRFQKDTLRAANGEEASRYAKAKRDIEKLNAGSMEISKYYDPRSPAIAGGIIASRYATLPPASFAISAVGQSDLYPYYFKVTQNGRQTFINNDEIENPMVLPIGRFDTAFVLIYLFPLLILALSYNVISQEKEQGTLAMVMSQPVALKRIVSGKIALRGGVILLPAIILSVAGFFLSGNSISNAGGIWRLGLWVLIVSLYGAFWFALAMLINSFGKSSSTNALALAGIWLMFVLLVPSIFNIVTTSIYPIPSRVEMIQAIRNASTDASSRGSNLLAKYYEDHPELAPGDGKLDSNDFYIKSVAVQSETESLTQPLMNKFDNQIYGQQKLVDRFRFISPSITMQAALNDLAGTGPHRYRSFLEQVNEYHLQWRNYFYPRILRKEKMSSDDYDSFPAFQFHEEPSGNILKRVAMGGGGLSLSIFLVSFVAIRRIRNYTLI